MADDNVMNNSSDFSKILGELLSNQEVMSKISEITGAPSNNKETNTHAKAPDTSNIDSLLSNPDIISKLPDVINVIKPIMGGEKTTSNQSLDKRMGLLVAMKPYLSPKRCEAIDYITRISKLSETLKGLKL